MAGTQKQGRLLAELDRRAASELGESATALDYIEQHIATGGMFSKLAEDLAASMGESVSRPFLSNTVKKLAPDARDRIKAARCEGAVDLIDEAVWIADNAAPTPGDVQKAKLQVGIRQFVAEKADPAQFGSRPVTVSVSILQMALEAMEAPLPPHLLVSPRDQLLASVEVTTDSVDGGRNA